MTACLHCGMADGRHFDGCPAVVAATGACRCKACGGDRQHASDCAVHNGPALPVGSCDCGEGNDR